MLIMAANSYMRIRSINRISPIFRIIKIFLTFSGKPVKPYEPVWFKKQVDAITGQPIHMFTDKYWECKANQDWADCPDLY